MSEPAEEAARDPLRRFVFDNEGPFNRLQDFSAVLYALARILDRPECDAEAVGHVLVNLAEGYSADAIAARKFWQGMFDHHVKGSPASSG